MFSALAWSPMVTSSANADPVWRTSKLEEKAHDSSSGQGIPTVRQLGQCRLDALQLLLGNLVTHLALLTRLSASTIILSE